MPAKSGLCKLTLNPSFTNQEFIAFVQDQDNRFKGKRFFNYCHHPNSICGALQKGNIVSQYSSIIKKLLIETFTLSGGCLHLRTRKLVLLPRFFGYV